MSDQEHWENVSSARAMDQVSWFRPHLEASLALIERAAIDRSASVIEIGGGTSTLVDDLVGRGFHNVTVLDISQVAINLAKQHMGSSAARVEWLHASVTQADLPAHSFDICHDRAVFLMEDTMLRTYA